MKAADTIRKFREQVAEKSPDPRSAMLIARLLTNLLADEADFAQLADGKWLRNSMDFTAWLRELEAVIAIHNDVPVVNTADGPLRSTGRVMARDLDLTCPSCRHEHKSRTDCGQYLGEGNFCRCEEKVPA
jgi:hypothetical protein